VLLLISALHFVNDFLWAVHGWVPPGSENWRPVLSAQYNDIFCEKKGLK
jgi:hypothetical protein